MQKGGRRDFLSRARQALDHLSFGEIRPEIERQNGSLAARIGSRPKRSAQSLVRPLIYLMLIMAFLATLSGFAGIVLAKNKMITMTPELAEKVAHHKHAVYLACFFAHTASYWVGFIGGGIQIAIVWISRRWLREKAKKWTLLEWMPAEEGTDYKKYFQNLKAKYPAAPADIFPK